MAYEVVMSYHLHMPSYFLGTFTEYPLVEGLNCNEYLAQFLGLFVYGGVNFLMNKKVTFK